VESRFDSRQEATDFSLLRKAQVGSGARPPSKAVCTWGTKRGHEADSSPPSNAEVKSGGASPLLKSTFSRLN
jgi:hypothetical protein